MLIPILVILLPAFVNITSFVTVEAGFLIQMSAPFAAMIYIWSVLALTELPHVFRKKVLSNGVLVLATAFIVLFLYGEAMQTVLDQQAMKEGLTADVSLAQTIMDEIIERGLYNEKYHYAIIGSPHGNPLVYTSELYDKANSYAKTADFIWDRREFWQRGWRGITRYRMGLKLKHVKEKTYVRLKEEDEEVATMPVFPAEGSIVQRDKLVIVKVSEWR